MAFSCPFPALILPLSCCFPALFPSFSCPLSCPLLAFILIRVLLDLCGHTELVICPSGNLDYNAVWPSGITAGTYVQGAYCTPGWTGSIGRQCQANGQWATTVTGGCTRTFVPL